MKKSLKISEHLMIKLWPRN